MHFLFATLCFGHELLLSGYITQPLKAVPIQARFSDEGRLAPVLPPKGKSILFGNGDNVKLLSNRRWWGRIGGVV